MLIQTDQLTRALSRFFGCMSFCCSALIGYFSPATSHTSPLLRHSSLDGSHIDGQPINLYLVVKEPDDLKTTLAYNLIGSGGYGIVIGKDWYHYRRSIFIKDRAAKLKRLSGFLISPLREATEQDIEYLNSLIGKKWAVNRNCKTILEGLS